MNELSKPNIIEIKNLDLAIPGRGAPKKEKPDPDR